MAEGVRGSSRRLFGIAFSPLPLEAVVGRLLSEAVPKEGGLRLLVTANLDHIVTLRRNLAFRAAYDSAWLATIDGMPVLTYARLRGLPVRERVTGADILPALLAGFKAGRHRPFFVCASAATAVALDRQLTARGFNGHRVVVAPSGFETNAAFEQQLLGEILMHGTTHLIFGLGAPKSEIWMHQHRYALPDCYGLGLGAALDFAAGTKRRAPAALRRLGLEWAWRVGSEPRRLARRYFVTSWGFVAAVLADLAQGRA
jgi:N-acetylglucosaminyldiphosphoundecaprenol N-acetyl-beta-D-mannosaminyltransferase